ncbi:hypothetical protein EYF80_035639 [Liparis tanakae]|uniref:Uncharacterized protein n=1 Tax=Liparis tanakae TaxID=230148 RepID=A0A4Z2GLN1_9TELE|nr:hypothetical protein EYF80_035639 [Liparis tanakae]
MESEGNTMEAAGVEKTAGRTNGDMKRMFINEIVPMRDARMLTRASTDAHWNKYNISEDHQVDLGTSVACRKLPRVFKGQMAESES